MRSVSVLVLLLVGTTSLAFAETPPPEAVRHSQACIRAYDLGEYQNAINECKAAYQIFPAPLVLFSLGQAHRKLGQFALALEFYRRYLAKAPSGSRLQDAQEQIAQLEPLIAAAERNKAAPPDSAVPDGRDRGAPQSVASQSRVSSSQADQSRPWYAQPMGIAGLVTLPLGIVLAGTGGGLLGKSSSLRGDAERSMLLADRQQLQQSADTYQAAGYALLGVGVAMALTGAIVTGVAGTRRNRVSASLAPSVTGFSFVVGGTL